MKKKKDSRNGRILKSRLFGPIKKISIQFIHLHFNPKRINDYILELHILYIFRVKRKQKKRLQLYRIFNF